jgi:hypothetical protein
MAMEGVPQEAVTINGKKTRQRDFNNLIQTPR